MTRPASKHTAYIGLGANLGDRHAQLSTALTALNAQAGVAITKTSSFYESRPAGPSQPNYLNAAARLDTKLSALDLLNLLLSIETQQGRQRATRFGPRTLDLDLLLFDQQMVQTPELTLPHPRLHLRDFVLVPLLEIEPALTLPEGTSLSTCLSQLKDRYILRTYHKALVTQSDLT